MIKDIEMISWVPDVVKALGSISEIKHQTRAVRCYKDENVHMVEIECTDELFGTKNISVELITLEDMIFMAKGNGFTDISEIAGVDKSYGPNVATGVATEILYAAFSDEYTKLSEDIMLFIEAGDSETDALTKAVAKIKNAG